MMSKYSGRRAGFTLFEMVLVVAGVSVVIGLCGGLLHGLLRLDRSGRNAVVDATTLGRLGRQFREDIRGGRGVKALGEKGGAILIERDEGRSLAYRNEGGSLVREERHGEKVRGRESYGMERLGAVQFEIRGTLVKMVISGKAEEANARARPRMAVEATLGKDRRLFDVVEAGK